MGSYIDTQIHGWGYKLNTWVLKMVERWVVAMISRRPSSIPHEDDVFLSLLYCHSRYSQTCRRRSQVLPGAPNVLSAAPRCSQTYHNHSHGTPVPVIRDPSDFEGQLESPPIVWYSPEIDASKFTLHILSDTPGGSQWLKYVLLMKYTAHQVQEKRSSGSVQTVRYEDCKIQDS